MTDFAAFLAALETAGGAHLVPAWLASLRARRAAPAHGDDARWQAAIAALPDLSPGVVDLAAAAPRIGRAQDATESARAALCAGLRALMPWRKGPFSLFGVDIDSEWRSDWKWQRLAAHLEPLQGRRVLDVGCGNGYTLWRLRGAGARFVLGVDPTRLYQMQFLAVRRYLADEPVFLLPLRSEDMPVTSPWFDTVLSMGVLYHRRKPREHLLELRRQLRPGGQLLLETLVIDAPGEAVLEPRPRYAQMRNVWQLPSIATLETWLWDVGFAAVHIVDCCTTTTDEQRRTEWMEFHSLADFLDPDDASKTVEGYPAPRRAIAVARWNE